ncbi:he65 [Leucania separata nucleopolyhedrovirus]|uniref:He65 n=1 Tax=Leucania separata nucleopolyhedrovirus TaxID=1307956 RepID=Q0IL51_NPVLS|nr:he65 [Leucania separata nucleopolyhedrovirus]AAR28832.1 he65 [Leucania separata nucleopolyhedrovirus]
MVYIKLDIGSHAKGYNTSASDHDYVIFTKCSSDEFLQYINGRNHLANVHGKTDDTNDDCTHVDLYKGLHGIYTGKYYYLGVFAQESDVPDTELFEFIRQLAKLRMPNTLRTMLKYRAKRASADDPKQLLAIVYNLAYVDRWLRTGQFPPCNRLPQLLDDHVERVRLYEILMKHRVDGTPVEPEHKTYVYDWRDALEAKLSRYPPLPERCDVLKTMVMYMLDEGELVMPSLKITTLLYPSIPRLDRSKGAALWGRLVCVQEKLDGCNFRIIVDGSRVTFGSRHTYLESYSDFMGYHRIRSQLVSCARRLQRVTGYNAFVVYGELVGWRDDDRIEPINAIHYSAQREPIKFYAYDIKRFDDGIEEDIEFELAQNFLHNNGQFDTIPYECVLYDDFVSKPIVYRSTLFPDHGEETVEGYVLRCDELRYKVKKEYKLDDLGETNVLRVITKTFVRGVLSDRTVDASNFDECLVACYDAVEPYNTTKVPVDRIFGKLFGLLCAQAGIKHTEYKQKLSIFKANKNIVN